MRLLIELDAPQPQEKIEKLPSRQGLARTSTEIAAGDGAITGEGKRGFIDKQVDIVKPDELSALEELGFTNPSVEDVEKLRKVLRRFKSDGGLASSSLGD